MLESKLSKIAVMKKTMMKKRITIARKMTILILQRKNKRLCHPLNQNKLPPPKIKKRLKKKKKQKRSHQLLHKMRMIQMMKTLRMMRIKWILVTLTWTQKKEKMILRMELKTTMMTVN